MASLPPWNSSQSRVDLGRDPADRLAVALGEEVLGLGVLEVRVPAAVQELHPLEDRAAAPTGPSRGAGRMAPSTNRFRSRRLRTGRIVTPAMGAEPTLPDMSETAKAPVDVFEKARSHDRLEQLEAAKQHDLLPYFRVLTSQAGPVVEMEGRETIMLGSNNYLGLTGDERVKQAARDALETYGTGVTGSRLLNGTTPLHVELERELAEWMGTEDAIVYTTGYQANVGCIGTILEPGDTVICDSGDHASILDGCRLSGAKLRPFRHNRMDKLEKMLERAARGRRRRPRRRRRRLLDGGRRLRPAADRRALRGPRSPPDGRRGARGRRARRPRRRRLRAVRARGRGRPADGNLLEEPRLLRRLRRRSGRRRSSTCGSPRAPSSSAPRRCRPPSAPRSGRCA